MIRFSQNKQRLYSLIFLISSLITIDQSDAATVNDISQLNPITVEQIVEATSTSQIQALVKNHQGKIAIAGGRNSMGGQTASENALVLDMHTFKQVLRFVPSEKEITVQAGITWRDIQDVIDPHNLSLQIMQSYANFTVGGSLSVNVHGRYIHHGAIIKSVKAIKLVLANGELVTASRTENPELFTAAIGGYGGIGVIVEATLQLDDNVKVERLEQKMAFADYAHFFDEHIKNQSEIIFHNADLYPPTYQQVRAISYQQTDKALTIKQRLVPRHQRYPAEHSALSLVAKGNVGKKIREYVIDPVLYQGQRVTWRNYEASYDIHELEPKSRTKHTYVLQEYFVPTHKLNHFVPVMAEILNRHQVNVLNVSIRFAHQDNESLLSWSKTDVFALVLYYQQETNAAEKTAVGIWTRELIEAALSEGGSYYLPYQTHATMSQFQRAYPQADNFFAIKQKVDPSHKFTNKLWDKYGLPAAKSDTQTNRLAEHSRFKTVLASTQHQDNLFLFLQNVYGLYPTADFFQLILEQTAQHHSDKAIYQGIQKGLPNVTPTTWSLSYALPALAKQKAVLSEQTKQLLGEQHTINGYLEIGSTGRYVAGIKHHFKLNKPIFLMNDEYPSYSPNEIAERGQLRKIGKFLDINQYDPIPRNQIADESLDLVTIYIGLHHIPREKLDPFLASVWRVLRPHGKLIIRDHDVDSNDFHEFVSLIHDAFYSGLDKDWDYVSQEPRFFCSAQQLVSLVEQQGFKADVRRLVQDHDPSKNTLILFHKQPSNQQAELNIHQQLDAKANYQRDEGQTYLTLPEWFLVYNPDEYGQYLNQHSATNFPYFQSIGQFWQYYYHVNQTMGERYDFNGGYHLMVSVLGVSYTVENTLKGIYENSIGRLSEVLSTQSLSDEDKLAAQVANDYVDFIEVRPWYEYSFSKQLKRLWFDTPLIGKNPLRKLERRVILSTEYLEKALYATFITGATRLIYGVADDHVLARVKNLNAEFFQQHSDIQLIENYTDGSLLISLPRYLAFREAVFAITEANGQFIEIAGNQYIFMTGLVHKDWQQEIAYSKANFSLPIATNQQEKRIALTLEIGHLHESLKQLKQTGVHIEHLYDY
ncbi:FAD-binding protein [Agitococcus lubricus]|uniref:FAD/FMN-containing dehydrogenase n=1 Tax=Agitococcus lubricus TaxID=1077255 RepID=A0A2T5J0G4_9GAMM|nr:FAD-binding protein [Agitococcus lubricus]PTQ89838.1 FAD/FMN-containing dehydrogenase [Agitococcus lubricus]